MPAAINPARDLMGWMAPNRLQCQVNRLSGIVQVPAAELLPIGTYDGDRLLLSVDDLHAIQSWCGENRDALLGVRLPEGRVSWSEVARGLAVGARQLTAPGGRDWYWRTQAGQMVRLHPRERRVEVFAHDDPVLPYLLSGILTEEAHRLVFGREPTTAHP